MPRPRLSPDVALDVHLSAICSRHQYTRDPGPVLEELHRIAGARVDILARVAAGWADYYRTEHTATLADALLTITSAADGTPPPRRLRRGGA